MTREEIRNGIIKSLSEKIDAETRDIELNYKYLQSACKQCTQFKVAPLMEFSNGYGRLWAKIEIDDAVKSSSYYKEWLSRERTADSMMCLQRAFVAAPELEPLELSTDPYGFQWEIRNNNILIPLSKTNLAF